MKDTKTKPDDTKEKALEKDWYEQAKSMTLEKLPDFIKTLSDTKHTYSTICLAITAAAIGAANAIESSPNGGGGITGFQTSHIAWQMIVEWGGLGIKKGDCVTFLKTDDLLYPQMSEKFTHISQSMWLDAQEKATKLLKDDEKENWKACTNVRKHWENIAKGGVPFGLKVKV